MLCQTTGHKGFGALQRGKYAPVQKKLAENKIISTDSKSNPIA